MRPRIYLLRHGETEWSLAGRHTGSTDLPLTVHGEAEAREIAPRLWKIPFAQVLTSPRQRARRTCELAGLGAGVAIEPDLAEWDYGDYEGQCAEAILAARPDWNIFRDGCPRGETPAQVSARADRLIVRLRELRENVALFTHGHFGRVLGVRWIGLSVGAGRHFQFDPASLSVLGYEQGHADQPVITLWNAASEKATASAGPSTDDLGTIRPRALERWENEGGEIPGVALSS